MITDKNLVIMDDNNRQYIVCIINIIANYPSFADRGITKEQSRMRPRYVA